LVGLFKVEWKTPHHNILVEFLNNLNLDFEHKKITVIMAGEQIIIDKHLLVEVFKICHIGEKEADKVEMSNVIIDLVNIVHKVPYIYNTNERWVVKKMKLGYANWIVAILPIIYQKDKVHYFNNKSTMMIFKVDHGKSIDWATIMYF
jgi:hypothetical protein